MKKEKQMPKNMTTAQSAEVTKTPNAEPNVSMDSLVQESKSLINSFIKLIWSVFKLGFLYFLLGSTTIGDEKSQAFTATVHSVFSETIAKISNFMLDNPLIKLFVTLYLVSLLLSPFLIIATDEIIKGIKKLKKIYNNNPMKSVCTTSEPETNVNSKTSAITILK